MSLKYIFSMITALIVFVFTPSAASAKPLVYQLDDENSHLEFSVSSTLHKVHGIAHEFSGKAHYDPETGKVEGRVNIQILVRLLKTHNHSRDRAMYRMFQADKFPDILWQSDFLNCPQVVDSQPIVCEVKGRLKIRAIERETLFPVTLIAKENSLLASGSLKLRTDDFELKSPSVLNIIRVSKEVLVQFKTSWRFEQP